MVLGREEFTLGFELVGIESGNIEDIETLINNKDIGIMIISKEDYNSLSMKLKNIISKTLKPIVIILSKEDIKGNVLREKIISAMGVDLLK